MIDVELDNTIVVDRGDDFNTVLFINQGTDNESVRYRLNEYDAVYLGITYPNQPFEEAIIKKKFTKDNLNVNGDVVISISHKDTECLRPGKYYYTLKLRTPNLKKYVTENIFVTSSESILKKYSYIEKDSIINGNKVLEGYYLDNDLTLSEKDFIKVGSELFYKSKINNEEIDTGYIVNTVIQSTQFILV